MGHVLHPLFNNLLSCCTKIVVNRINLPTLYVPLHSSAAVTRSQCVPLFFHLSVPYQPHTHLLATPSQSSCSVQHNLAVLEQDTGDNADAGSFWSESLAARNGLDLCGWRSNCTKYSNPEVQVHSKKVHYYKITFKEKKLLYQELSYVCRVYNMLN